MQTGDMTEDDSGSDGGDDGRIDRRWEQLHTWGPFGFLGISVVLGIATADPHLARGDVRFEPLSALAAGPDGLADLRRLIAAAPEHLKPGGALLLEHGYDQANAVRALLQAAGFSHPQSWPDLSGICRVSGGILSE